MENEFTVLIEQRDKDMNLVARRTYPMVDYTNMLGVEIKHIITEVENVFYEAQKGKPKEEWDSETKSAFGRIRHKLLDCSNAIARMPYEMNYRGMPCMSMKGSDYVAAMLNGVMNK